MKKQFKTILIESENGVAKIILNRPDIHNAFNDEMIAELTEVMEALGQDKQTKVILLTGAGNSFCAGADLNWMKKMASYDFEENVADAERLHEMLLAVFQCPKPVVAHVNGAAIGGGCGLVAAVDMAYAQDHAVFGFSEVRLGLVPAVISPFVLRKVGEGNARELFLTGERFSAERAFQIGLIQQVGSPEEIEEILAKKLKALQAGGPEALAASKKLIQEVVGLPVATAGNETAQRIAERRASPEGKEGMSAFLNKQKPKWVPDS